MKAVVVNLDVIEKDARRNERLSGLIDLELGGKAKWVLVYRTEDKRSLFVAPGDRVCPEEAADVLMTMGHGLEKAIKLRKAGQ
jgi:hypothetical protein